MNHYNYEAEFRAYNLNSRLVDVFICFNIDEDETEVLEFSQLVFKKCYAIEMGHVFARYVDTGHPYTPTDEDLKEWNHDIKSALKKEFNRQVA